MKKLLFTLLLYLCSLTIGQAQIALDSTVLDTTTIVTGLDIPWEIQWGPDGWIWVTERYGRLGRVDPDMGTHQVLLDLSSTVHQVGESGLLGMVLHPNFADTPQVFIVYTYRDNNNFSERLVRYDYNSTTATLHSSLILIDNIPANNIHNGARLLILPDRTLLMTTGDAGNIALSQDITSLNGKVLRLNLDGSIPTDNPFQGSAVWSWGHRNAQGLYLGPNGIIYSSEHGPTNDDEMNILERGRNYGWPYVEGYCNTNFEAQFCADSNVVEPIEAWTPTVATSDLIWYDHPAIPEFRNSLLMTTLKDQKVIQLQLDPTHRQVVGSVDLFSRYWGRLRDICTSPDGRIFLATSGLSWGNTQPFTHSIIEIKNTNYTNVSKPQAAAVQVAIYPNPTSNQSRLRIPQALIGQPYYLYNHWGKVVCEGLLKSETILDGSALVDGVYLIHIPSNGKNPAIRWTVCR